MRETWILALTLLAILEGVSALRQPKREIVARPRAAKALAPFPAVSGRGCAACHDPSKHAALR